MPLTLADLVLLRFDPAVHDTSKFDCSGPDLNEFLTADAQRYQEHCLSHTRLAFSPGGLYHASDRQHHPKEFGEAPHVRFSSVHLHISRA